jgi:AmmeMemoRadiSam system protein A
MPVDHTIVEKIVSQNENIRISSLGHQAEHAVEVQIPFLQVLFPRAVLVPIVLGKITDYHEAESIAADIANSLQGKRVLLVASTDLYHGYSYSECVAVNKRTVAAFTALQPRKLFDGLETGQYQACGGHAVVMMENVALALGARTAELLKLTNSNDVIGERGSYVVGYSSVMVTTGSASRSHEEKVEFKPLPIETQKTLLQHARMAIAEYMSNSNIITINTPDSLLQQRRGVFVTLTKDGQLRGCIGYHETDIPLSRLVPQMAVAAAFEDPRFPPLSKNEMDRVKIKISVYLTNIYPIKSIKEFQMGRDGIILRKNGYSATFLPEVPLEAGWKTVEDELKSLCLKAGLPPDAWHEGAEFWIYRTQVFDESIMKY